MGVRLRPCRVVRVGDDRVGFELNAGGEGVEGKGRVEAWRSDAARLVACVGGTREVVRHEGRTGCMLRFAAIATRICGIRECPETDILCKVRMIRASGIDPKTSAIVGRCTKRCAWLTSLINTELLKHKDCASTLFLLGQRRPKAENGDVLVV